MTEIMIERIRALFHLFAVFLLVFGGVLSWNLFFGSRIGMGTLLPNWSKILGPTIFTIAILLLRRTQSGRKKMTLLDLNRLSSRLLIVGIGLIVVPPIVGGCCDTMIGGEGMYLFLFGIVYLTLPGIGIFISGGIIGVLVMLRKRVDTTNKDTDDRPINYYTCPDCAAGGIIPTKEGKCTRCGHTLS